MRRLRRAEDETGVLLGEEPFGDVDKQQHAAGHGGQETQQGGELVAHDEIQAALVSGQQPFKAMLKPHVEPAMLFHLAHLVAVQKFGAEHGRQCE